MPKMLVNRYIPKIIQNKTGLMKNPKVEAKEFFNEGV
jgi:hypothetical protein